MRRPHLFLARCGGCGFRGPVVWWRRGYRLRELLLPAYAVVPGIVLARGLARRGDQVCPACGDGKRLERWRGPLDAGWLSTWEKGRAEGERRFRRTARMAAIVTVLVLCAATALVFAP